MASNKSFVSSPMVDDCDSYTSDETVQSKVTVIEVLAVKDDAFMVYKKYVNATALNLSSDENVVNSDRGVLEKEVDDVPDVENVVSDGNKPLVMLKSGKIAFNGSHAKSVDAVAVSDAKRSDMAILIMEIQLSENEMIEIVSIKETIIISDDDEVFYLFGSLIRKDTFEKSSPQSNCFAVVLDEASEDEEE
ncbi:hypothetical protein Tco_0173714 [Tanacetum coccineum]